MEMFYVFTPLSPWQPELKPDRRAFPALEHSPIFPSRHSLLKASGAEEQVETSESRQPFRGGRAEWAGGGVKGSDRPVPRSKSQRDQRLTPMYDFQFLHPRLCCQPARPVLQANWPPTGGPHLVTVPVEVKNTLLFLLPLHISALCDVFDTPLGAI